MTPTRPTALITGGSRGIGLEIAHALAGAGHRVVLAARDPVALEAARQAMATQGLEVRVIAADLRDPDAPERVAEAARAAFGTPVHVLVNNAGTAPTAKFEATTDAILDETLDLHVRAPLALIRAVLPAMRDRDEGCIVQLASTAGLRAFPFTAAYTAAKHAMVGLTRVLAAELQNTGVRTCAVCPGFVDTDITRQAAAAIAARGRLTVAEALQRMASQNRIGRMHAPAEVASAVVQVVRDRPAGCVYELDHEPPRFLD
ncbi:MAG: SDR family NAD(P)-dependent oxidoreductase [Planctomycetota bacterium]